MQPRALKLNINRFADQIGDEQEQEGVDAGVAERNRVFPESPELEPRDLAGLPVVQAAPIESRVT